MCRCWRPGQARCRRQAHQPLARQRDGDADGGGRRLDQSREQGAGDDPVQRPFHRRERVDERRISTQRPHRVAHEPHAVEDQPQPHEHHAPVPECGALSCEQHEEAHGHRQQRVSRQVEGEKLRGDGAADIGTHDHRDRLGQGHRAGGDKAHDQHRGHAGRVEYAGDHRASERAEEAVRGEPREQRLEAVAGRQLQAFGELVQAEQEQRQAAGEAHGQCEPVCRREVGCRHQREVVLRPALMGRAVVDSCDWSAYLTRHPASAWSRGQSPW